MPPTVTSEPAGLSQSEVVERIQQAALDPDELQQERWKDYSGCYGFRKWGQTIFVVCVRSGDQLEFNGYPVFEVEPGLFYALDGEVIDFRGSIPTVSNTRLEKDNGTLQTQSILLRLCIAGFLLAILWNGAGFVRIIIQRRREGEMHPPRLNWLEVSTRITITLASLLALVTILSMLIKFPVLLFNGVPLPHGNLPFDMRFGFSMIYAAIVLTLLSVGGVAFSWSASLGTRLNRNLSSIFTGILVLFSLLVVM